MSEPGTAQLLRHDDGTITVEHADDLIRVSRTFLENTDRRQYHSGVLTLDTAGEYRYQRVERLDAYVDLFERIAGHGRHTHAYTRPAWNGAGYDLHCRCGDTKDGQ